MSDAARFYTIGGTLLPTAKSYVTRRADHELLAHLLQSEFCYVLTSRQMGKSSLMVRTAGALRAADVKVAILDLTRIGQNLSPEQWYDGLMLRLGSELDLEDELEEYWIADRVARLGPMQRFMSALREIVLPSIQGNLAIFIDEIDSVRSLPFSSDEFFAGIRECYNSRVGDEQYKRIAFCLLGVAQPSDLISNVNITPFNIGRRIELTDFSESEAGPLLEGLRDHAVTDKDSEALLRRVLYWTGGHPYLTQRLCEALGRMDGVQTVKNVDALCEEMFLSSRSREKEDNLIFVRDRVLASREHRAAILDLYAKVRRGERVRDDDSNATLDPLRLSGLIVVAEGFLKVRNRIYASVFDREWILKSMPDAEIRRQKAAYWRGIFFALGVSLPVLAVIIALSITSVKVERAAIRDSFFSDTVSIQEAFNVGDYGTAKGILSKWNHSTSSESPSGSRFGGLQHWIEDWTTGRSELEDTFPVRLLRAELGGESIGSFPWAGGTTARSPCDAVDAVATTNFNGHPLVALAGEDSSVQIWDLQSNRPFAHLQLTFSKRTILIDVVAPLRSCDDIESQDLPGIRSLRFSPDGTHLAIGTGTWSNGKSAGSVILWEMGRLDTPHIIGSFAGTVDALDWGGGADGIRYLAASSEDVTAKVWKFSGDTMLPPAIVDPRQALQANAVGGSGANAVALSDGEDQDHLHLMAMGYGDGRVILYDYHQLHFDGQPHIERPLYTGIAHVSGIMSMTFLRQKGRTLRMVVGSRDGDLVLIDPQPLIKDKRATQDEAVVKSALGSVLLTLHPDQGVLQGLATAYNRDHSEAWLLISGSNGTVGLWTITPNFHLLSTLHGHSRGVNSAAFCPEATNNSGYSDDCLITASDDLSVRLWHHPFRDREDHRGVSGLLFPGQVIGVHFPVDATGVAGNKLVAGMGATTEENHDHAGTIAVWDYTKHLAAPYEGPSGPAMVGFGVSPDGKFSVSTSRTRELSILDLARGPSTGTGILRPQSLQVHVSLQPKILVRCLSPDAASILEHCADHQAEYLIMGIASVNDNADAQFGSGQGLCKWHITDTGPETPAQSRYVVAKDNFNPCVSQTMVPTNSISSQFTQFQKITRGISVMDIANRGDIRIATATQSKEGKTLVQIWKAADLLQGNPIFLQTDPQTTHGGFDSTIVDIAFSPDGKYLAASTIDALLYYWNVEDTLNEPVSKEKLAGTQLSDDRIPLPSRGQILAFSPTDPILAIGTSDARIILWNTEYRRIALTIRRHSGGIYGVAFSPDGQVLASGGNDGRVRIWKACGVSSGVACASQP